MMVCLTPKIKETRHPAPVDGMSPQRCGSAFMAALVVLLFVVISVPVSLPAAESYFYTVQMGAYETAPEAEDVFVELLENLAEDQRDYLRVEVVSDAHTVRVGKFANRAAVEAFVSQLAEKYPAAAILQAPIDERRITRIHRQKGDGATESSADEGAGRDESIVDRKTRRSRSTGRVGESLHIDKDLDLVGPHVVTPVAMLNMDDNGEAIRFPSRVFFDSIMNEVYVVASGGRIIIYGPDYFCDYSLGEGRGLGNVTDLVVDDDGRVLLTQLARLGDTKFRFARLTVLNAAFFPEFEVYLNNIEGVEGFIPQRLALGIDGIIYIVGQGKRGFMVLDENGRFLRFFKPNDAELYGRMVAESGRKGTSLEDPGVLLASEIAVDRRGRLFIASEETGKIYVYNSREQFLYSFGLQGGSTGKLSRPRGVAFDEEKRLVYVVDFMRHTILVYDMDNGDFLFEFSGRGWSPGWLNYPGDIAVGHKNNVIVADRFNHRVQVLEVQ